MIGRASFRGRRGQAGWGPIPGALIYSNGSRDKATRVDEQKHLLFSTSTILNFFYFNNYKSYEDQKHKTTMEVLR